MSILQPHRLLLPLLCLFLLLLPSMITAQCNCTNEDEGVPDKIDKPQAMKYKIVGIVSILIAGIVGMCIPMLGKTFPALSPEKEIFFIIKAFAAGVILATGFIHVLPDAYENLTSSKLSKKPWSEFPFTGLVAMASAIATLMVDAGASSYYNRVNLKRGQAEEIEDEERDGGAAQNGNRVHDHASHGHAHGPVEISGTTSDILRHRVVSQVLELGIVVHSVIIGIAVGASETPKTIRPLVAAITFHQLFEGMGLGGCITQAKFKNKATIIMTLFFCLTAPIGIVIGIGITNIYDEDDPKALIIEGILNAASAGILIYMALVDLLAADFMNPRMQNNSKLQILANISLLVGAALMSLLAIWA